MLRLMIVVVLGLAPGLVTSADAETHSKDTGTGQASDADSPEGALGFTFGWSKNEAQKACADRHGEWSPGPAQTQAEYYACDTRIGALNRDASIALQFIQDHLAGITASYQVKPRDAVKECLRVVEQLTAVYGSPSFRVVNVPRECGRQRLRDCLVEKKAEMDFRWVFKTARGVKLSLEYGPLRTVGVSLTYATPEGIKVLGNPGL
jgi:hypothetical protein